MGIREKENTFFSSSRKVNFLFVQENELIYLSKLSDNMFLFHTQLLQME